MEIRRVRSFDGGYHLVNDELQYRERAGERWKTVSVLEWHEAFAMDLEEGIENIDDLPDSGRDYWRGILDERKSLAEAHRGIKAGQSAEQAGE